MSGFDPTLRFSDRVENYVRYRPGYPVDVLNLMRVKMGLTRDSVLADIGSGTGISSRLFLENDNVVVGVEPNAEMRAAAERDLAGFPRFRSVNGRAEATTLPDYFVDFVIALQAFHWFDRPAARVEFGRILRPGGHIVLVWNERRTNETPFLQEYEHLLLQHARDYAAVRHENIDAAILTELFGPAGFHSARFDNHQMFDFAALKGRLLSSSYVPAAGEPHHREILDGLAEVFARHAVDGSVRFDYDTRVYSGRLS